MIKSKRSVILWLTLFLLTIPFSIEAQVYTAVPFIMINPSSRLNGMAGAFTALPTNDVYGQYYNPAQLGNFSRDNNLSWQFYNNSNWFHRFSYTELKYSSTAAAAGYNFKNLLNGLPLSIGFGYINTELNLGTNIWTDEYGNMLGEFETINYYSGYSIGIGLDYYAVLNIGYTYKDITNDFAVDDDEIPKKKDNAYDIGLQVSFPIISIIDRIYKKNITIFNDFKPSADIAFGYSVMSLGDDFEYPFGETYPLPRTAQMGLALSFSLETLLQDEKITVVKLDFSSEGRDMLVKGDSNKDYEHVSAPGDIKFWGNVIKGNADEEVDVHKGWRIQIYEIFEFSFGNFSGEGWGDGGIKTFGFRTSSRGLLKLLNALYQNRTLSFFSNHFELSYAHTQYAQKGDSPLDATIFNGVAFTVFGF